MPTILVMFGLRFYFFSQDHDPAHVHVVKGGKEAKIRLLPEVELVWNHGLSQQDISRALKIARSNKELILEAWHEHHQNG